MRVCMGYKARLSGQQDTYVCQYIKFDYQRQAGVALPEPGSIWIEILHMRQNTNV